jgi:hypothetical protein
MNAQTYKAYQIDLLHWFTYYSNGYNNI